MTVPRAYPGHEGTDVGGRPNGLPIGTPVYAAAPGLVTGRYDACKSGDVSCGDAYGNHVLLEHALVRGPDVEVWFTGYAHLQAPLVSPSVYIRDIGVPIALSGDTGLGGAHLHFEVRAPHLSLPTAWIDPWDRRPTRDEMSLWVGGYAQPISAAVAFPAPTLLICQTAAENNLRAGPGTSYAGVGKTQPNVDYAVFQVVRLENGSNPGDWYQVWLPGSDSTAWVWSDLMTGCQGPGG
jgi:murein DD-endopeptidase MepM/ murein hydrolase activator NlpD